MLHYEIPKTFDNIQSLQDSFIMMLKMIHLQ